MTTDPREIAAAAVALVKPRLRGWLHAGIAPLALAAAIVLIALAPTGEAAGAAAAFGASAVLLFTT
ncbi:MAG TPA: hemolysin III family protein, partial [Micromonosporaceae bacterium]